MKSKKQAQYTPDDAGLTFFEAFQKSIEKYEIENPKQYHKNDSDPFTIYEDLKLILELSKIPQIEVKHFEKIANLLKRTKTSLRLRYQEYLKHINQDDLQIIYSFLQQYGAYGYLVFQAENGNWKLKDIEPAKKQFSPQRTPLQTPAKGRPIPKPDIQESSARPPIYQLQSQQQSQQQQQPQQLQQQQINDPEPQKRIKISNKFQLSANSKYEKTGKKLIQKQELVDVDKKTEAEELKQNLKLISEILKISYQELVQRMYQCSGDLNALLDIYLNHQENLLWTREADEALKAYLEEDNEIEKQKLRAILNGDERIENRRQWLQM